MNDNLVLLYQLLFSWVANIKKRRAQKLVGSAVMAIRTSLKVFICVFFLETYKSLGLAWLKGSGGRVGSGQASLPRAL
jgi:hypothetical protein